MTQLPPDQPPDQPPDPGTRPQRSGRFDPSGISEYPTAQPFWEDGDSPTQGLAEMENMAAPSYGVSTHNQALGRNNDIWLWRVVGIVLAVLIVAAGMWYFFFQPTDNSPKAAVVAFGNSIIKRRPPVFREALCPDAAAPFLDDKTTFEYFDRIQAAGGEITEITADTIPNVVEKPNVAYITAHLTKGDAKLDFIVLLNKIDNKWKVCKIGTKDGLNVPNYIKELDNGVVPAPPLTTKDTK